MKNSGFGWRPEFLRNFSAGHSPRGRVSLSGNGKYLDATPAEKQKMAEDHPEYSYPAASAGLYTTAADYARFMGHLMQPGTDSFHLSDRMTAEMCKAQVKINDSIDWGLGWGLERSPSGEAFWHWGDWGVFRNFAIGYRKSRMGVVVLTNSFHGPKAHQKIVTSSAGADHPAFAWVDSYRP